MLSSFLNRGSNRISMGYILMLNAMIAWCQALHAGTAIHATTQHDSKQQEVLVLIGAPGSGKGTLAEKLSKEKKFQILTASQLVKATLHKSTPEAKAIAKKMAAGQLLSDDLVHKLIADAMEDTSTGRGVILDGYPRTIGQLKRLQKLKDKHMTYVVINVKDQEIIQRMSGRRIHPGSGRVYHIQYAPPKNQGQDDITGEPLQQRADDKPSVVKKRLKTYHQETQPVINAIKYQLKNNKNQDNSICLIEINGQGSTEQVWHTLQSQLAAPCQATVPNTGK